MIKYQGIAQSPGGESTMFDENSDIFSRVEWTKGLNIARLSMQHNVTLLGRCYGKVSGNCSKVWR